MPQFEIADDGTGGGLLPGRITPERVAGLGRKMQTSFARRKTPSTSTETLVRVLSRTTRALRSGGWPSATSRGFRSSMDGTTSTLGDLARRSRTIPAITPPNVRTPMTTRAISPGVIGWSPSMRGDTSIDPAKRNPPLVRVGSLVGWCLAETRARNAGAPIGNGVIPPSN